MNSNENQILTIFKHRKNYLVHQYRKAIDMILYHAISSYQILCVLLHKQIFHNREETILILPDFIIQKYGDYQKLKQLGIFNEIYLFPYLNIPHNRTTIATDTSKAYKDTVPHDIRKFSNIYVAGAHFYFSLFLLEKKIYFDMFEDAAGMASKETIMYDNLHKKFPIHAEIAKENGLFSGNNKYIKKIWCLERLQTTKNKSDKMINFDVMHFLKKRKYRKAVIAFFVNKKIKGGRDKTILLTEHFSNLGVMSQEQQKKIYLCLKEKYLNTNKIIIKPHPDDNLDYKEIFPEADIINAIFPSELLPYVFNIKPKTVVTISSTGITNLTKYFQIRKYDFLLNDRSVSI